MPLVLFNRKEKTAAGKPIGVFLLLTLLAVWGCSPAASNPIVIFCSPNSPRMQQAIEALKEKLPEAPLEVVCVPEFNDELKPALRHIQQLKPKLLVVLGTPALLAIAPVEKRTPMIFALVADPYFTGAAAGPEHPEEHQENLTGIASPPPLEAALKQGGDLLGKSSWGLLYDPTDGIAAELAEEFTRKAPQFGITPLTETSTGEATDPHALKHLLARGARVIYLPPAASAARYAPLVLDRGQRLKVMVVSGYPEGSHKGALLWVAMDYHRLGEEAAALARRVLGGEAPKKIAITQSTPLKVEVDEKLLRYWSGYPGKGSGQ